MKKKDIEDNTSTIQVHLDTVPNILKMPGQEEKVKGMLRRRVEQRLDDMISRYRELPAIIVHFGKYSELLLEARDLFVWGKFYSCVAMCGITAERIAKELLRTSLLMRKKYQWAFPSDEQAAILDRIEMNDVRELLIKSEVIDENLRKPFQALSELRNKYAHATGKKPKEDAKLAIIYLHQIIEGTVSVFKNYEIKEGKLVLKQNRG